MIGGVRSAAVGVLRGAVVIPTSPSSLYCAPRENPKGCRAARSRIPAFVELGRSIADNLASMKPALLQEPSNGLIESQHELRLLTRVAYGIKGPEHLIPPLSSTVVAADPPLLVGQRRARPHGKRREPEFSGHAGSAQGPHCSASEVAAAHNSA